MSMGGHRDSLMRNAAFERVRRLSETYAHLTRRELNQGFQFKGQRIPLVNPQRGIFKPRQMKHLLSIRTVIPRKGGKYWYDDQRVGHEQIFARDESIDYAFMGTNPAAADNQWLRKAFEHRIPIIYFLGIAPGRYIAIFPVFISGWDSDSLKARVVFSEPIRGVMQQSVPNYPKTTIERRYALRGVKQRLHQASFRQIVLSAYGERCALSGLPEPQLLDAAHIISDRDHKLGQPIVSNGLPLSKIHHAAFDSHLIGIDPDYRLHLSDRLREKEDGPLLEALKSQHRAKIHLPRRKKDYPDRDRLAQRFERFQSAR